MRCFKRFYFAADDRNMKAKQFIQKCRGNLNKSARVVRTGLAELIALGIEQGIYEVYEGISVESQILCMCVCV